MVSSSLHAPQDVFSVGAHVTPSVPHCVIAQLLLARRWVLTRPVCPASPSVTRVSHDRCGAVALGSRPAATARRPPSANLWDMKASVLIRCLQIHVPRKHSDRSVREEEIRQGSEPISAARSALILSRRSRMLGVER